MPQGPVSLTCDFFRDQPWRAGDHTYGEPKVWWWGEPAELQIGKYCSIAQNVEIFLGGNHRSDWVTTYPFSAVDHWPEAESIAGHPATRGSVVIGNDVWIAARAMIHSGVTIGDGAVIGAASVVRRDVPPYAIVLGNPAEVVRMRFSHSEIAALLRLKWWDWDEERIRSALPDLLSPDIGRFLARHGEAGPRDRVLSHAWRLAWGLLGRRWWHRLHGRGDAERGSVPALSRSVRQRGFTRRCSPKQVAGTQDFVEDTPIRDAVVPSGEPCDFRTLTNSLPLDDANMQRSVDIDALTFPEELDLAFYRSSYADLARMTDAQLVHHYENHGRSEGRHGNGLKTREDFLALVPATARALEIGPFCAPVLKGDNVKYFDVLDRDGLEKRAEEVGYPHRHAPFIAFVSSTGDLSIVNEKFHFVVSSHCIEHQPDLIDHLRIVSRILEPGGRYFVLVPDKRYCFDAFLPESNVAEVIDAHHEGRRVHSLRHVMEHRALTTHNDCILHWAGQHGDPSQDMAGRITSAISEYERSNGAYIDVHAWQFTPTSMGRILSLLSTLDFVDLGVERTYPTRRNHNEFWCILRKPN